MAPKRKPSNEAVVIDDQPPARKARRKPKEKEVKDEEECEFFDDEEDEVVNEGEEEEAPVIRSRSNLEKKRKKVDYVDDAEASKFIGEAVADEEARRKWPHRYLSSTDSVVTVPSKGSEPPKEFIQARLHFTEALVDGRVLFNLGDDAHVYAGEDVEDHICRIVEMFQGLDGEPYFCAQWFYRAKDTMIKACSTLIDDRRIFFSEIKDNSLDCLTQKVKIVRVPLDEDGETKRGMLSGGNYYYDMMYIVPFSTFQKLPTDNQANNKNEKVNQLRMLDLYSGCGGMSTGLCLGANLANVNLVTSWAVDLNKYACKSLELNHPETQVRNESAGDFLLLLKEWERLCQSYLLVGGGDTQLNSGTLNTEKSESVNEEENEDDDDEDDDEEVYEVEKIVSICYGDPSRKGEPGVHLKICWKDFDETYDTWEPIDTLGGCMEKVKEFVIAGFKAKILPLPGDADVICGGPPCQGVSGFNRFRNTEKQLDDDKNKQLIVFMDIVEFLKPRFVLMENVVDILRFADGYLGKYALARLISINYQARVGLMTAGCYGLPQFRMRMFMWGARPNEMLPQYPLPTHNVVSRGAAPVACESNIVIYDEKNRVELQKELYLEDAISDLPPVTNDEKRDEISYGEKPKTEFQKLIRQKKQVDSSDHRLYDHRPYKCNADDFERVCQIPKRKGANFRDLPDVVVNEYNVVALDTKVERKTVASGKPLVPDYALTFVKGKSSKPFGRLWWDEIVSTVVTRPQPHNQIILHPVQDRVLTVRENARLQGFSDYYKLVGPVKERYMQVGNAVAVPVARALGYSLAMSYKGTASEEPVFSLPKMFPIIEEAQ